MTTSRSHLRRGLLTASFLFAGSSVLVAQQAIQPRMGEPMLGLTSSQLARFAQGRVVFETGLIPGTGLGPIFNDVSCGACHSTPDAGGSSTKFVVRFGKAASGPNPFDPLASLGGSLQQVSSINSPTCDETIPPQADVTAQRLTPSTFGLGLVEAILDGDLLYNAVFPPPGVSGIAHMVSAVEDPPLSPLRVGRMGWKSQDATLLTFSSGASLNELGLTNRFNTQENAPNGNAVLLAQCDLVADPEDGPDAQGFDQIDRQRDFQRFLAKPPQTPRSGMAGEPIFNAIGCASCHISTPFTAGPTAEPGIANVSFRPYTDFLLHDMGAPGVGLGDGIVQGQGTENELRTPSLWGLRARSPGSLLHDGRVNGGTADQNNENAILAHAGEGQASANAFAALSPADKAKVLKFLDSLGRAEFDIEGNNNVDEFDWFFLQPLLNGPNPLYSPEDPAAVADFDQDGDFDVVDFGVMQRAFTGQ